MYHEFSFMGIKSNLRNKTVEVIFNKDIKDHKDFIVEFYERNSKDIVHFDYHIINEKLVITLRDWAKVNTQYIIGIKNAKSVTGDKLNSGIKKIIEFKSGIVSKAKIVSPSDFEEVDSLIIKLKEITTNELEVDTVASDDGIDGNDEKVGSYYIEVATDNAFINKTVESMFHKEQIKISLDKAGQHYMRARVQKELEDGDIAYGEWSPITTFIYKYLELNNGEIIDESEDTDFIPDVENDLDPEVDLDELELVEAPQQGITGESFIFEFNKDLEDLIVGDIYIIRKDVK